MKKIAGSFLFAIAFSLVQGLIGIFIIAIISACLPGDSFSQGSAQYGIIANVIAMIPCVIVVLVVKSKEEGFKEKIRPKNFKVRWWGISIISGLALGVFSTAIVLIDTVRQNPFLGAEDFSMDFGLINILMLIGLGVIIPICEELVFRGVIQNEIIKEKSFQVTLLSQAVIYSFMFIGNVPRMVFAFIYGMVFGGIYYKSKSLLASVICHGVYASSVFIGAGLFFRFIPKDNWGSLGKIAFLIISITVFLVFRKDKKHLENL